MADRLAAPEAARVTGTAARNAVEQIERKAGPPDFQAGALKARGATADRGRSIRPGGAAPEGADREAPPLRLD